MFFDGGTFWGREPKYGLENLTAPKGGAALVAHFEAVYYDMFSGNDATLVLARKYPDVFLPMAVINPLRYDVGESYIKKLKSRGFKALALLPHYQNWKLSQYAAASMAEEISAVGLPLQIGVANLDELALAARTFSRIKSPVLIRHLRGGGYNAIADEIAMAAQHRNFYFDVSNLVSLGGIKYLSEKIGSDRLYLATNSPLLYSASPEMLVRFSGLAATDLDNILFNTLANIFKVAQRHSKMDFGAVRERSFAAELKKPKIDIHWHSEGWDLIEPGKDFDATKRMADMCGYQAVITSSILALNYDLARGNKNTADLAKQDARFFGYIVVDPTRVKESLIELKKYVRNPRFLGIKTIQDYYGIGLDHAAYEPILRFALKHNLPILAHKGGLAAAARKFPKVIFIAAHCTSGNFQDFKDLPNVYLDVSGSYAHKGETDLRAIVAAVGADRVLYSSDGPLIAPFWAIGKILDSDFSESDLAKIYRLNVLRVFSRLARHI